MAMSLKPTRGLDPDWIGYLKYSGAGIERGVMDARKSAHALLGFDAALRHFLSQEAPALRDVEYEIPVLVRPGSWEALIPLTAGALLKTALGAAALAYSGAAAKKMADNDFKDIGLGAIFKKSLVGMQSVVALAKHLGTLRTKQFQKVKWDKEKERIGIPNEQGEHLFVRKSALDLFVGCPPGLFTDIAAVIQHDRELEIGVALDGQATSIRIQESERHIFYIPDSENEPLFPDLKHGQGVELEGVVTRGNETSNSIGFQYQGHILACYPQAGSIVRFKSALFLKCRIRGVINRADDLGGITNPRPKIFFESLIKLEKDATTPDLFPDTE